jgi:hypothetical protein
MDKYIAWDKENNKVIYPANADWEEFFIEPDGTVCRAREIGGWEGGHLKKHPDYKLFKSTGKTDIHGKEIYYDFHIVKFKHETFKHETFNGEYEFIGIFHLNEDELRAEIDIYTVYDCSGFWYDSMSMSGFEIIGNIKKNPELIREGK